MQQRSFQSPTFLDLGNGIQRLSRSGPAGAKKADQIVADLQAALYLIPEEGPYKEYFDSLSVEKRAALIFKQLTAHPKSVEIKILKQPVGLKQLEWR